MKGALRVCRIVRSHLLEVSRKAGPGRVRRAVRRCNALKHIACSQRATALIRIMAMPSDSFRAPRRCDEESQIRTEPQFAAPSFQGAAITLCIAIRPQYHKLLHKSCSVAALCPTSDPFSLPAGIYTQELTSPGPSGHWRARTRHISVWHIARSAYIITFKCILRVYLSRY
jgi:hypothetical protein